MSILVEPVGYVHSTRAKAVDDFWDQETAHIKLTEAYGPESLQGLDTFSHVAVIFHMHQINRVTAGVRRPRHRADGVEPEASKAPLSPPSASGVSRTGRRVAGGPAPPSDPKRLPPLPAGRA